MSSGSISTLGVGSGLDLQGILEQLKDVDKKAITKLETQKTTLEEKIQEYNKLNADLLSLKSTALNLSMGSNFLNREVKSSGSAITATAVPGSGAKVMSHQMEVTALASHSAWNSGGMASKTDLVTTADETFSFKLGEAGSVFSIDAKAGITLQMLANLINENDANPGVTATIADTGIGAKPYRLVLTSDKTGEDNRIFMESQVSGLELTESGGAFHATPTSDNKTGYSTTLTSDNPITAPITSDNAVADTITITTGSNDEIVFRETLADGTLGDPITATITPGTDYTPDALAAAMETAMEAASLTDGNEIDYTVSFDAGTKTFSIQENGSDLDEMQIEWGSSSAAADLGFDAATDTFTTTRAIGITAGTNDEIVFRETLADGTLGPQLTATIAARADYTPEELAAAMETSMEAASLAGGNEIDYTVSYDDKTKQFSIKENGSDLHNLTMEWGSSSAAADLGFDAVTDTYDTISITAGTNDEIVFRERLADGSLGDALTATIPAGGTYTPYSLATAMETAMEAASLAGGNEIDYTVSFDAESQQFSIQENGSELHELSMEWGNSSAAGTLGFDSETDTYKPYESILNARFTVDSIAYQRQSNTEINDVIMGLNLDMTATGTTSINVTTDLSEIKTSMVKLVETLNSLKTEIDSQNTYDIKTQKKGLLFGESSVNRLAEELADFVSTSIFTNSSIKSLTDLGFEINRDGSFALDEDKLDSVLKAKPEDVQDFFIGDLDGEYKGFGDLLNEKLRNYTGVDGLITSEKNEAQTQIDRLTDDIEEDTKQLDKRYEIMAKQFVELDIYMRKMTAQSDFLKQMFEPTEKK